MPYSVMSSVFKRRCIKLIFRVIHLDEQRSTNMTNSIFVCLFLQHMCSTQSFQNVDDAAAQFISFLLLLLSGSSIIECIEHGCIQHITFKRLQIFLSHVQRRKYRTNSTNQHKCKPIEWAKRNGKKDEEEKNEN